MLNYNVEMMAKKKKIIKCVSKAHHINMLRTRLTERLELQIYAN